MFPIYRDLLLEHKVDTVPSTTWYLSIVMMVRGRGDILLMLIVCAIVFLQPRVMGKYQTCTSTKKKKMLMECRLFILEAESSVSKDSPCCKAVRAVPNRNMQCVVSLLSDPEKKRFKEDKILSLQNLCELP